MTKIFLLHLFFFEKLFTRRESQESRDVQHKAAINIFLVGCVAVFGWFNFLLRVVKC